MHAYTLGGHILLSPYTFSALFNTSGTCKCKEEMMHQGCRSTLCDKSVLPPTSEIPVILLHRSCFASFSVMFLLQVVWFVVSLFLMILKCNNINIFI